MSPEVRRRRRSRSLRRLRRYAGQRPALVGMAVVAAVVLLGVLWGVWRAVSVAQDLEAVDRNARILRDAMVRGDTEGARAALERYQTAATEAEAGTGGPTWALFEALPVFGDDAAGVHTAADVLAALGRDGLPPVVDAAEDVTAHSFHPENGTFPLERIAALEEPAGRSERAFAAADQRLRGVDPDGFIGPVHGRFIEFRALVSDARSTLGSAYRAARLMPTWLGADGPRDYLLVMQNNAELRSSGGLPGSLSVVHAENGHVEIVEQEDMADLEGTARPVLPLTREERALFGTILGRVGVNATLTPDFVRAADLIRARWKLQRGQDLDGVFFVDPVAVSYLLGGTGPVPVPGYAPVAQGNVVASVENDIYLRSTDNDVHSDYQNAVAKAVFDAFSNGQGDPATVIRALNSAVVEGRIRIHSFVPVEQREIAGTAIAGEFTDGPRDDPSVGVYVNDSTQSKMSYYLRYDATLVARSCTGQVQTLVGSIELTNDAPDNVDTLPPSVTGEGQATAAPGQQRVLIYLTSPVSGSIREIEFDKGGQRVPAVQRFRGRDVAPIGVLLKPGETRRIDFVIRTGRGQTGDVDFVVTPNAQAGTESRRVLSTC